MKNLLYIGNKLSKHGNTTTIIETLGASLENEGYNVTYSSNKKNQIIRLLDMVFTTLININKIDYVIIDTYSTFSFNYALIISQICRVFKKRYIPILHGGNLPNRLEKSKFLSQLIFNNSYKNVAPSHYLLNAFLSKGYSNIIHIPNAIELNEYAFLNREFEVPKLLWVRSFAKIYNPKMAIKVLAELRKEYSEAVLCMVGPDKENLIEECKSYAKSLTVNVQFTGKLSKQEWIELSKEYNVFINTTHFDNTPVSVIEAMSLGLPVVSTNVGGIPFLVNDNSSGLLVNDDDVEGMVNAIKSLFNDKGIGNQLIIDARKIVENFDWNVVKYNWFEILK
jgi:glycosyltransferase involved in cell wall biosynthesis